MSRAYKVSSIRQADDAINNLNDHVNSLLRNMYKRIDEVRREADCTAQRRVREEAERAKREMRSCLNKTISDVNSHIDRVDEEQRRRLNIVANEIYDTITQLNNELHGEIDHTRIELKNDLQSLEQRTNEQIKQVNQRINQLTNKVAEKFEKQQAQLDNHSEQLDMLTNTLNSILVQMADERKKRMEAVNLAHDIKDAAYARIDIERFNPQKSQEINRRIAALTANPDDEGTVARASEVILQIQMAEEEALRNKIIYDSILAEATSLLEKTLDEVNKNREISIAHPDSQQDTATIETDFWSRGEYEKLRSRLETLKAELNCQPSLDRIKEIMEDITIGEVQLTDMLAKAVKSAILSENRVVITEDIITALIEQGWQVEEMNDGEDAVGYLGGDDRDNDWREGVFAVLQSMNGERISIVVRPDESETNNDIIFHRNDNRNITDVEYIRSLERIKQQIAKSGYKLGTTETPADGGDSKISEMSDVSKLGKCGAAKKINQRTRKR